MATKKASKKADATAAVRKAAQEGLKGFDDKAVVDQIVTAYRKHELAEKHSEAMAEAAWKVCCLAQDIREQNKSLHREAWRSAWRKSMAGIMPQLFAKKISWVEQTERKTKNGVKVGYKLTSYGQNISSDANRTGQFDIDAKACGGLRATREAIKAAAKAEAEANMSDADRQVSDAEKAFRKAVKGWAEVLQKTGSPDAWERAAAAVVELAEREAADLAAQEKLETAAAKAEPEGEPEGEPEAEAKAA